MEEGLFLEMESKVRLEEEGDVTKWGLKEGSLESLDCLGNTIAT